MFKSNYSTVALVVPIPTTVSGVV